MNIMTCEQTRCKDSMAMMRFGIPGLLLMEHAALGVLREMERRKLLNGRIVVMCGRGNNGGDGYALAFHERGPFLRFHFHDQIAQNLPVQVKEQGKEGGAAWGR